MGTSPTPEKIIKNPIFGGLSFIGAIGITVVWIAVAGHLFNDQKQFWALVSLVLTPLFTPFTGWMVGPLWGVAAIVSLVLMAPRAMARTTLQRRYE